MGTELITDGIWKAITRAARKSRRPASVAVAYFGRDAGKLLPLRAGSRLVVDASEHAVKSGQTCPAELAKLVDRGVQVFSVGNLHAKLFVFGNRAFIGSTNASNRSAHGLVEAVVATTERETVKEARKFIRSLCRQELGPEAIKQLKTIYRPPRMFGGNQSRPRKRNTRSTLKLSRLFVTQIGYDEPPEGSEKAREVGERIARKKRKHRRTHLVAEFWWSGHRPYRVGDSIIQVFEGKNGRRFVCPPGNVIHLQTLKWDRRRYTFIYLELPDRRRVRVEILAKRIGYGAKKQLDRTAWIRKASFAEKLRAAWE